MTFRKDPVPKSQILMVGDDPKNDYEGALAMGLQAKLLSRENPALGWREIVVESSS